MNDAKLPDLRALQRRDRALKLCRDLIVAGPLLFVAMTGLSAWLLTAPSVTHSAVRYHHVEAILGMGQLIGLGVSAAALPRYLDLRAAHRRRALRRLLATNGWTLGRGYKLQRLASILVGSGLSYVEADPFSGKYGGRQFSSVIFRFEAGNTRRRQFICLHFRLPKAYPTLLLDNKLNDHGLARRHSDLPNRLPDGVTVALEGDFGAAYALSMLAGQERAALQVLSPKFMAALQDVADRQVDIEVSGQDLFLIYEANFYSAQNMTALFTVATVVLTHLDALSKTWLASSKSLEAQLLAAARTARHRLLFQTDYAGLIFMLLAEAAYVLFIWSQVKS